MAEPDARYSQLRSSIATLGVHVRSQAVEQRFGESVCGIDRRGPQEGVKQVISYEGVVPELFARFNGVYAQEREHCGLDSSDGRVVPWLRREKPGGRKE